MATGRETLEMILSARDDASATIGRVARSGEEAAASLGKISGAGASAAGGLNTAAGGAEKLGQAGRPLGSVIGLIAGQLGAIGPVGNVAGNVLLGLATGLSKITLVGGGATVALGLAVSALQRLSAEKKAFDDAMASGNTEALREQVGRLEENLAGRSGQSGLAAAFSIVKGAILGTDQALVQSKLEDKVGAYRDALNRLDAQKLNALTAEFERQKALLDAGPFQKIAIEYERAAAQINAAFAAGKVSFKEMQVTLRGLQELRDAQNNKANASVVIAGRSEEVNLINRLTQLEGQLLAARRAGDTANQQILGNEINALRTKVGLIDQETAKKRGGALQAITDGLSEKGVIEQLNFEVERQNQLLEQGQITVAEHHKALTNLGSASTTFANIKAAADAFYRGSVPLGTAELQQQMIRVQELEAKARTVYGVNVPASVQLAIDRMRGFIGEVAKATNVDLEALKNKTAQVALAIGGSFAPTKELEFLRQDIDDLSKTTADLGGGFEIIDGVITNLTGPVETINNEMAQIPSVLANARDNAIGFNDGLTPAVGTVAAINAQLLAMKAIMTSINANPIKVAE